jgi:homoserine acetyltransferase
MKHIKGFFLVILLTLLLVGYYHNINYVQNSSNNVVQNFITSDGILVKLKYTIKYKTQFTLDKYNSFETYDLSYDVNSYINKHTAIEIYDMFKNGEKLKDIIVFKHKNITSSVLIVNNIKFDKYFLYNVKELDNRKKDVTTAENDVKRLKQRLDSLKAINKYE